MNRKTLASLMQKGGLTAVFEVSKKRNSSVQDTTFLENLASSLSGEKPYLILDFSCNSTLSTSPYNLDTFFNEDGLHMEHKVDREFKSRKIDANGTLENIEGSDENVRTFLKKLVFTRKFFPEIVLVFDIETGKKFQKILHACKAIIFNASTTEAVDEFAELSLDLKQFDAVKVWYSEFNPPTTIKKLFAESSRYMPSKKKGKPNEDTLIQLINKLRQIKILQKNKPEGIAFNLSRVWPILAIIMLAIPLVVPTIVSSNTTKLRDMRHDRDILSEAPYFEYEFDGTEPLRRIARYSIGRFHSKVTDQRMVTSYIGETLNKNDFDKALPKSGDDYIPEAGTRLKFYPMDSVSQTPDSVAMAWQFFTSMLSDSISYITEFYHKTESKGQRKHNGIDLAGKRDARILAPFAAKAWTFQDERGGVVLGLVQKDAVILFMHCDKLLYLDGQNVMAGDPVATVGVTGHTTGPHAHIVTGVVTPNGEKSLGGIRYKVMDPVSWYNRLIRNK